MPETNCRFFNGYKPCGKVDSLVSPCSTACVKFQAVSHRILLIHLGALGAVVRSTALLPAIQRKYPGGHVTWVTDGPADVLLQGHPLIDRVLRSDAAGLLELKALEFDVAFVVDKSIKATGVLRSTTAREVYGFVANSRTAAIEPASHAAHELWSIGLSNHLKFHVNQKPETQLVQEALELGPWSRDKYSLFLSEDEKREAESRRRRWSDSGRQQVVGLNTGCATTIPHKKLSVVGHVDLMALIKKMRRDVRFVLLGGREDKDRNRAIADEGRARGLDVIESETEKGLRDGMISVAGCDAVVTGDSLGMHMALGLGKRVVAWFGPTCAQEIDLYGGISISSQATCSPCWKRECDKSVMCYDQVDFVKMASAAVRLLPLVVSERPLEISPDL